MPSSPSHTRPIGTGVFPGGCVVLSRPDLPKPAALINALESRGLAARLVHDEPSVMMLFAERPVGRRILVVVEPGRWDRLAELICAVQAYHREVLCWQFTERSDDQPRLKTLDQRFSGPGPSPVVDARSPGPETDTQEADSGPVGRIVGRNRPVDALLNKVPGRPLSTREVVTQQELTMLLGPLPGEAG